MSEKHSYGCVMYDMNVPGWLDILQSINQSDLYGEADNFGYEVNPHCTLFFGFKVDVKPVFDTGIKTFSKVETLVLGDLTLFENGEYDVLKFDVIDPTGSIYRLHDMLDKIPNANSHPEYKPHCTVAYLKAGAGKKYAGAQDKRPCTCTYLRYSTADREVHRYPIGN